MVNKKIIKSLLVTAIAVVLAFSTAACGGSGGGSSKASSAASSAAASSAAASSTASSAASSAAKSSAAPASSTASSAAASSSAASSGTPDLSTAEFEDLMQQVADNQLEKRYVKFLNEQSDQLFATAHVYGIDREGDKGKMYARLYTAEYIVFKAKAYDMQGSSGDVIINFEYAASGPKLKEVVWSADAAAYKKWMEDNYPAKYLKLAQAYNPNDASGKNLLEAPVVAAAEKRLGVPVEPENQLTINDDGTYELVKIKESGTTAADYKFETEVIDKGKL
ncbi:MAG: hypothetical protein IK152_01335 [Lachnospiraceae bacterium]|nr:hypothetical protein [Lachnospiraceae bacterium]